VSIDYVGSVRNTTGVSDMQSIQFLGHRVTATVFNKHIGAKCVKHF